MKNRASSRARRIPVYAVALLALTACNSNGSAATGDGATPPPVEPDPSAETCAGYATRYWDCCKAHCGWVGNAQDLTPTTSCAEDGAPQSGEYDHPSRCDEDAPNASHTCFDMAPWAVSPTLSYGFAAVPATGDICGRCYRLEFAGTGHDDAADPGSVALAEKVMIVQATNIGHDVGGGQFDILIPGGGVGQFDGCSAQFGVSPEDLGAEYGGFRTACQVDGGSYEDIRACVRERCENLFAAPAYADLLAGCEWYVDWYAAADNPNLRYREVECPEALIARSGTDRRPLDDVALHCSGGTEGCGCECDWTGGGANCGDDDGSCCWNECCGG